jgi:hypothetical protein
MAETTRAAEVGEQPMPALMHAREQALDLLEGYFVHTLRLDLEEDIPAAADDIVALCARWVAEALEALASRCADALARRTTAWVSPSTLRALAAEYRDGKR